MSNWGSARRRTWSRRQRQAASGSYTASGRSWRRTSLRLRERRSPRGALSPWHYPRLPSSKRPPRDGEGAARRIEPLPVLLGDKWLRRGRAQRLQVDPVQLGRVLSQDFALGRVRHADAVVASQILRHLEVD